MFICLVKCHCFFYIILILKNGIFILQRQPQPRIRLSNSKDILLSWSVRNAKEICRGILFYFLPDYWDTYKGISYTIYEIRIGKESSEVYKFVRLKKKKMCQSIYIYIYIWQSWLIKNGSIGKISKLNSGGKICKRTQDSIHPSIQYKLMCYPRFILISSILLGPSTASLLWFCLAFRQVWHWLAPCLCTKCHYFPPTGMITIYLLAFCMFSNCYVGMNWGEWRELNPSLSARTRTAGVQRADILWSASPAYLSHWATCLFIRHGSIKRWQDEF